MSQPNAPSSAAALSAESKHPARARGYPLIGALPAVLRDAPGLFQRVAREHPGEVIELGLGVTRLYIVTHPDQVQHVIQDNWRNFTKGGGPMAVFDRLLGNGLVTANGDVWLRNRRLMQPLFSTNHLAGLVDRMVAVAEADVERLVQRAGDGQVVSIDKEMMDLTQRIILATMFGTSLRAEEIDSLGHAMLEALDAIGRRLFLYAVPRWLLPGERALQSGLAQIDAAILRMVRERREAPQDRRDLLSLLIGARYEDGSGMEDQQLRDELVTMFVAGNETTAIAMTWLLYLLDQHPEVDRKVRAELDEVLGDRTPTAEDLPRLEYCKLVIQETLRMFPPAWISPRVAEEADRIGGYRVPAGAIVCVSPYITHYDPAFWDDPSTFDPERFRPERAASRPRHAYIPFSGGPRQCIGNTFAIMESQVILAVLRRRLRARLVPGHPVSPHAAPTLKPRHGMKMMLHMS